MIPIVLFNGGLTSGDIKEVCQLNRISAIVFYNKYRIVSQHNFEKNVRLCQPIHTISVKIMASEFCFMLSPIGFGVTAFAVILSIIAYLQG